MKTEPVRVVAAVVERDGSTLVARRRPGDRFGGLWEFPGGKVEPGESAPDALRREILEELGVAIEVGERLGEFPYEEDGFAIVLDAYRGSVAGGEARAADHEEVRWANRDELGSLPFAPADRAIVAVLTGVPAEAPAPASPVEAREPAAAEAPARRAPGKKGPGTLVLQPGKDRAVRNRHHWIFSGAIRSLPDAEPGTILPVRSFEGEHLGFAYVNPGGSIAARMLSFDRTPGEDAVRASLARALALRRAFFEEARTDAVRLVNAEGDALPGLVVDRYADVLVLQSGTAGMDRLKPLVVEELVRALSPRSVMERSDAAGRREEGLEEVRSVLVGALVDRVDVREEGMAFRVDVLGGQKTGFYLDQRANRALARSLAAGRRVLNAFAYTGGFSVAALLGGASRVDAVDASDAALALARENLALNGMGEERGELVSADVFELLRRPGLDYDFVILDPPAFAKRRSEVVPACRGYKDINRLALRIVRPGGLVFTFSCSHFVEEGLFRKVVFEAAAEAGRPVRILERHRQAFDHPVNVFHPETEYLKGYLLYVE